MFLLAHLLYGICPYICYFLEYKVADSMAHMTS
jgi:hypothetical protein